jgi:hypothetical protein
MRFGMIQRLGKDTLAEVGSMDLETWPLGMYIYFVKTLQLSRKFSKMKLIYGSGF